MSNVVVVGTRDHKSRIEAALVNFAELRTEESLHQLVRTIRIMLLQYHGALLESADQKGSSAFDAASNVDEALMEIESASPGDFPRLAEMVRSVLKPLYAQFKRTVTLSIGQVRSLQEWTMQTSFGNVPRLIILEELFEPIFDNPIRLLTDQSIRRLPQGLFEFISERWILCHLFESAAQDRNSVWLNARSHTNRVLESLGDHCGFPGFPCRPLFLLLRQDLG